MLSSIIKMAISSHPLAWLFFNFEVLATQRPLMSFFGIVDVLHIFNNDLDLSPPSVCLFVWLLKRPTLIGFTMSMLGYEKFVAHSNWRCNNFIVHLGTGLLMLIMGYERP